MTTTAEARQRFLEDYRLIRRAEGRGSDHSEYYRALPLCGRGDPNAAMWDIRAQTYRCFINNVLKPLEAQTNRPLNLLDLGAGNCWLSHQLAARGHHAVALDIFNDERDGLGAARHYSTSFKVVEADFDHLPLSRQEFDLAIFNASFHYSVNYLRTLSEVRRCLRPSGLVIILDTPIYRLKEHGMRMAQEKHAAFTQRYGFPSDSLPSLEFLDYATLNALRDALQITWDIFKPWYGWRWHLRPFNALVRRRRPPSQFWILAGRFQTR